MNPQILAIITYAAIAANLFLSAFVSAVPTGHELPWWVTPLALAFNAVIHALPSDGLPMPSKAVAKSLLIFSIVVLGAASLSACAQQNPLVQAPAVTINPQTNVATSAAATPSSGGLLDKVATDLGNDFSPDIANAYNLAAGAKPSPDALGEACAKDWIDLASLLKTSAPAGTGAKLGTLHVFTDLEQLRLNILAASNQSVAQQEAKTFVDCFAVLQDTKARGLAIPAQFNAAMASLAAAMLAP